MECNKKRVTKKRVDEAIILTMTTKKTDEVTKNIWLWIVNESDRKSMGVYLLIRTWDSNKGYERQSRSKAESC